MLSVLPTGRGKSITSSGVIVNKGTRALTSLATLAVLLGSYVLSYAPVYRWKHGASTVDRVPIMCGNAITYDAAGRPVTFWELPHWHPMWAYRPVEMLMDHTPLRAPLLSWAGLFEVQKDFEFGCQLRELGRLALSLRGTTP